MAVSYYNCLQTPAFSCRVRLEVSGDSSYRLCCSKKTQFKVLACSQVADKGLALEKRIKVFIFSMGIRDNLMTNPLITGALDAVTCLANQIWRKKLADGSPIFSPNFSCKCPSLPSNFALVETLLDSVKWDDKGLAVAIAQNVDTGAILMQGFANRDALATTISSRKATFFSRSRSQLWTKGETSSNFINVHDIFLDCDRDSIIYLGKPDGPTCHTGAETCYFSSISSFLDPEVEKDILAMTTMYSLESTISERKAEIERQVEGRPSWTKKLLLDEKLLCSKIREEADELCRTLEDNEDSSRSASEMADVLYHSMVLLALKDVKMEDVLDVLRKRFSKSGIEEKKSRK